MKIEVNNIYNMDCLKGMDMMIEQGIKVDAVITDPPYGMKYDRHIKEKRYKVMKNDSNVNFLESTLEKMHKTMNNNAYIMMFCSWHNIDIFKKEFEDRFHLKNILIWNKGGQGMGDLKTNYGVITEFILFGVKKTKGMRQKHLNGKRENNVISVGRTGNKLHPTQKPIGLIEKLIEKTTNENDIIFDGFIGSATLPIACMNTNRQFIGFELEKGYYDIAIDRINKGGGGYV